MEIRYGARIYFQGDTIQIKQTVRRGNCYVIDRDDNGEEREDHARPGPEQANKVLQILEQARKGQLTSETTMFGRRKPSN